ncbi:uncharacterized protein [Nicotiana tomentosiformis]|uniref:uncharacterized protein n=1 Tax=Nicotiana tomentosiformis TaxID=4098 RepID=UPI00388CA848
MRVSIHLSSSEKEEYIQFLKEYEDIFAWSYDDMTGLSTSIVAHKLATDPMCPPVKQKLRKFKPDMSLKNKRGSQQANQSQGEDITESYDGWRILFDGAANFKGVGIGAVLVLETGQHYPVSAKLRFPCTNNMAEYEACILGFRLSIDMNVQELLVIGDSDLLVHQVLGEWAMKNTKILPYLYYVQELMKRFTKIEFKHVPRIHNEFADALATLSSMIQHLDKNFIDHIPVGIHNQPAYCAHVEENKEWKSMVP